MILFYFWVFPLTQDGDPHQRSLHCIFTDTLLTYPNKWQKRSKSSRGGINTSTFFSVCSLISSFFYASCLFVSVPGCLSAIHLSSTASLRSIKRLKFQMECFSLPSSGAQLCSLSLYLGGEKKLSSLHQRKEIWGWKEQPKPTYTHKCGSSIFCPLPYLTWYSEPYQCFCNDKVIMAIPVICLSDSQRFPLCPQLSSPIP